MKTLIATCFGLMLAVFAVTSTSSCSITHRSGDFECADQACPTGRTCIQGLCVDNIDGGAAVVDATVGGHPDAAGSGSGSGSGCPAGCSTCVVGSKTCTIDCAETSCAGPIACPAGWNCDIECTQNNACRNVTCVGGASCVVACSGNGSCRDVECGAGSCNVTCSGNNACQEVNCNDSCACDVTCGQDASCNNVSCTGTLCETQTGCSSQRLTCHDCPAT